jgi:hypothetical protein
MVRDGNGGIIRSPIRAIVLPDKRRMPIALSPRPCPLTHIHAAVKAPKRLQVAISPGESRHAQDSDAFLRIPIMNTGMVNEL